MVEKSQLMTGCLYGDVLAEVLGHIDQYIGQKGVISTMPICVLSTTHQKPNSSRCELEVKFIFIPFEYDVHWSYKFKFIFISDFMTRI